MAFPDGMNGHISVTKASLQTGGHRLDLCMNKYLTGFQLIYMIVKMRCPAAQSAMMMMMMIFSRNIQYVLNILNRQNDHIYLLRLN